MSANDLNGIFRRFPLLALETQQLYIKGDEVPPCVEVVRTSTPAIGYVSIDTKERLLLLQQDACARSCCFWRIQYE
jgi:hypothetical protein